MKNRTKLLVSWCVVWQMLGCEPITYSRESTLDYSRYHTARVDVNNGDKDYTDYLIGELRDGSGFVSVIRANEGLADILIDVSLTVDYVDTGDASSTDAEGVAHYTASDVYGEVLLSDETSDTSTGINEAAEDTLDQVASVFLAPYRI